MLRWIFGLTIIALLGLAGYIGAGQQQVNLDWKIFPEPVRRVEIETVPRTPITQKVLAPGHLQPARESRVLPPFSATVSQVLVSEEQAVQAGQELIRLDDKPFRTALDAATRQKDAIRESYDKIREQFGTIEKQVKQWEAAYPADTQAPAELVQLRDQLETLRKQADRLNSEFQSAENTCKNYRTNIQNCILKAPHAGIVVSLNAAPGDNVGTPPAPNLIAFGSPSAFGEPPSLALLTVAETSKLVAKAWVDESDVALVRAGQPSRVSIQNEILTGKIDRISSQGRRQGESISFDATISLDIPPQTRSKLRSGMSAMIEIDVETRSDALSIPVQAVVQRRFRDIQQVSKLNPSEGRQVVLSSPKTATNSETTGRKPSNIDPMSFVRVVYIVQDKKAMAVPVQIGISDEEHVEILSGLKENDLVVTGPYQELDRLLDDAAIATSQAEGSPTRVADSLEKSSGGAKR